MKPEEKTQPGSSFDLDSGAPPLKDPGLLTDAESGWTVIVWDHQRSRLQLVSRVLSECEAQSHWMGNLSAIQQVEVSERCNLALVALGECPSQDALSLGIVRTLRRKGFKVICYEEGAKSWPVGLQCQTLLAGSLRLLDSSVAEFARELKILLLKLLQVEARRWEEEKRVKGLMRGLGIVGESQAMVSLSRWILRVSAVSDLPVLITGETGTGKQLVAHAIHQLDPKRSQGPFIAVNCGAISPHLVESELFGHRRGAFTGADRDRKGLIRSAEGGVLFLDEIGELDGLMQTKLLRVLQENRVLGVGEDQEVPVNVQVIAATNRDLHGMVQQGKFRADLFHRLNVLSIHIPPLRQRPEDIEPLVEHFLQKYRSLSPVPSLAVAPDFAEALAQLELPGNARQLENLVRQALIHKDDDSSLNLSDLSSEVWQRLSEQGRGSSIQSRPMTGEKEPQVAVTETPRQDVPFYLLKLLNANGWNLSRSLKYCEKLLLEAALHTAQGNQTQTAKLLGITPRSIYNKLRKLRLTKETP